MYGARGGPEIPDDTVVLLLPGMTLNGSIFPPLDHDTIAVDFCQFVPGTPDRTVSMDTYVSQLETVLAGDPFWRRPRRIVVGHSFGGMLALHWLLQQDAVRRSIDGLVLVAASAGPLFGAVTLRVGSRLRVPLAPLMGLWNVAVVTRAAKAVLSPSRAKEGQVDFRSLPSYSDAAVDRAGWRNTDWRSMRAFRLALDGFDCRHRLGELDVPTIVLHGDRDSLFAPPVAEDLAARISGAELRMVEGAAHILPLTHGDAVVSAVHDLQSRF